MSDWKIGTALALGVLGLGLATGEPVAAEADPFGHEIVQIMERLPMDDDGIQRMGAIVNDLTGEPCGYAVAFEHVESGFWFGACDGDDQRAFAWSPSGDVTETGNLVDVVANTIGAQNLKIWIVDADRLALQFVQF